MVPFVLVTCVSVLLSRSINLTSMELGAIPTAVSYTCSF